MVIFAPIITRRTLAPEIGNLEASLLALILADNDIEGPIPEALGRLSSLEVLSLDDNDLTGGLPTTLGDMVNLRSLYLDDNELTGAIVTELGKLSVLVELRLEINEFTSEIPTELGQLVNLRVLSLYDSSEDDSNLLTGTLPCASLGNLASVESLILNDNELSGTICTEFATMSSLKELRLDENFITGAVRNLFISSLRNHLCYFHIRTLETYIHDVLFSSSQRRFSLELSLSVHITQIPPELTEMEWLEALVLDGNNITSTLPQSIGKMTELQVLRLHDNFMTGTIPNSIAGLKNLFLLRLNVSRRVL